MKADWTSPVAAFRRGANQAPVGAGVLVACGFVLTCAHVVEESLKGSGAQIGIGSKASIDFPFANIEDLQAEVVGWHPTIPETHRHRAGPPSDLAVLKLAAPDCVMAIDACLIADTGASANTKFASQGYPNGYPKGALA